MGHRTSALLAMTAVLAALTAGCAEQPATSSDFGAAASSYPGEPASRPATTAVSTDAYATVADQRLAIVLYGSSSCPPHAESADTETMTFTFSVSSNDPCTADLAPTTFEFDVPSTEALPPTVTVNLNAPDIVTSEVPVLR